MTNLPRRLTLLDSISVVVGIAIGGGIFIVPNLVARSLPNARWIFACWAFAGVVSFFGALASAELGAAMPATGGQYVFIREAFGSLAGFLYGWSMFLVARTAQVAWLSVTLALFLGYFVVLGPLTSKLVALGAIALFAAINYIGANTGAVVQKVFFFAKLVGLAIIVVSAFLAAPHAAPAAPVLQTPVSFSLFGVAMIACLLSYDGWVQVTFVAGEIKQPQRNIFLSLAIGIAICMTVYLLANAAYLRVLSIPELAASTHVGADAAERTMGPIGGTLVSGIILLSIIGTLNGCFLTSPRIYFAQARDGLFFRKFGDIHPKYNTPAFAIVAQAVWSSVLVLSGTYETLMDYAMFTVWIFYGCMVAAVITLRKTKPDLPRPYRMWGYPFSALVFLAVTVWFLGNTLVSRPGPALWGLAIIAAGIPVYFLARPAATSDEPHKPEVVN